MGTTNPGNSASEEQVRQLRARIAELEKERREKWPITGAGRDVADIAGAEEELRESKELLGNIMNSTPSFIYAKDRAGRFLMVNSSLARAAGLPKENTTDYDFYPKEVADEIRAVELQILSDGIPRHVEEVRTVDGVLRTYDTTKFPVRNASGDIIGLGGVTTDITEIKQSEARLREAQKLESLAALAGGVAHDFNNLLVGVIGNASLAQDMLPPDHPVAELLAGILKAGEKASHLTRQMLAYSGKGRFVLELLDLSALVQEMTELVRTSIPKKIAIQLDLKPDLPHIEADRGQVQQVFMNLALNAAEAIGSREGLITIETEIQYVDSQYVSLHPEIGTLSPGKYVFLAVHDTGCGLDEATRAKIFDPFFSTKFVGRGLGLAAVAGIARGHKGGIAVCSVPGRGSCFTALFPASEHSATTSPASPAPTALHGAGVVLVVDDEELVRETTKKALECYGYTVLAAESGRAAIDVFRSRPGEIALVVLDLSMPHMSGEETLPELRKIRPDVKVVVSSGYSASEAMTLFSSQQVSGFVQKPYTPQEIAAKVKSALG